MILPENWATNSPLAARHGRATTPGARFNAGGVAWSPVVG